MLSIYSLQQNTNKGLSTYEIQDWWGMRERKWEKRERKATNKMYYEACSFSMHSYSPTDIQNHINLTGTGRTASADTH